MLSFKVPDMSCGGCAASVRKALGTVEGVQEVEVDLATKDVRVAGSAKPDLVRAAIEKAGFEVEGLSAA
ncbi:heavy-metal-associated domain-containing protein [Azospirillum canadense]|uniref:heavy-metal-associated domain-containing protein n=1 Tax=Azospirillum canadense TaxID=403962 RepID=UPI00222750C9|nr:heavy metal-associated domain-containing protein [Azospirillum canadense]MCW2242845.1 copper chaperone [Azospirillum canadense]